MYINLVCIEYCLELKNSVSNIQIDQVRQMFENSICPNAEIYH